MPLVRWAAAVHCSRTSSACSAEAVASARAAEASVAAVRSSVMAMTKSVDRSERGSSDVASAVS